MNRRKFILWVSGLVAAFLAFFGLRWRPKAAVAPPEPTKPPEAAWDWEDIYAMMEDIVSHVERTGEVVRLFDNPMTLRIGFACKTKVWQIRLIKLKASLGTPPETYALDLQAPEMLRPYFGTIEGRGKIAAAIQASGMSRRRDRGLA